jgi:hypothetical protein
MGEPFTQGGRPSPVGRIQAFAGHEPIGQWVAHLASRGTNGQAQRPMPGRSSQPMGNRPLIGLYAHGAASAK